MRGQSYSWQEVRKKTALLAERNPAIADCSRVRTQSSKKTVHHTGSCIQHWKPSLWEGARFNLDALRDQIEPEGTPTFCKEG